MFVNTNVKFDDNLTDIIYGWARELGRRMWMVGIEYDGSKDFYAVLEGDYIIVFANPILNKDMEIEGEEFEPRYNIEAHIITPPPTPKGYWTDDGMYKWDKPAPATINHLVPRIMIRIPYLVVALNKDGSLFRDGNDTDVTEFLQERVNEEQERIGRQIMNSMMPNGGISA